jgi:hypothetical protein
LLIALIALSAAISAGPVRDTSALVGTISDSSGRPISKAQIHTLDSTARTTTGPVGQFTLQNLHSGANRISVRAIGYAPVEFTVDLAPGETRHATITLRTIATRLTAVVVNEIRTHQILRELGFYDRAGSIRGTFLTPEILATRPGEHTGDLLRGVNGVQVQRVNGGALPFSGGGYISIGSQGVCLMNLYIDGSRVEIGNAMDQFGSSPSREMQKAAKAATVTLDDVISGSDIGAIEVYPSGVTSPQQYTGVSRGCGTIVMWTKSKLELSARDSTR